MKNFSVIAVFVFIVSCMVSPAYGAEYGTDFLEPGNPGGVSGSLKTFDEERPISVGETFSIDIWAADIPETIISSGFEMFYNPAQVSLVSVAAYDGEDRAGPWDGTVTVKLPDAYGPGSYVLEVVQLGICPAPDAGGDIIIARVTFQCLASGSSDISVQAVDNFNTTVGCTSFVVYDSQMGTHTITIFQEGQASTTTSSPSTTTSSSLSSSTTSSPSTTTTTIKRCLSEAIYGGNGEETRLLRHFRDTVLRQTAEGRELISLYYLWSPVIVSTMEENEEFTAWVREMIDDALPLIQKTVQ
jgi:hypothetical protein